MKNWKTSIAGLFTGAPVVIDALVKAYNAGSFTGKSTLQVAIGVGVVLIGLAAKDHDKTGLPAK